MSLGYIGYCRKKQEDEKFAVYEYSGANWNSSNYDKEAERAYDGEFCIKKAMLLNPVTEALEAVEVTRLCKNSFIRFKAIPIDYIVLMCLRHITNHVKNTGEFPEKESFIQ